MRTDENSYYSGLWVDDAGLLQKVNPQLTPERMPTFDDTSTHTFNGVVYAHAPPGQSHKPPAAHSCEVEQ